MIHQIWLSDNIPTHIANWMQAWQQVDTDYHLWRYDDVKLLMPEVKRAGLEQAPPALQSDLLRLIILEEYGGLYIDCDCEMLKPIPKDLPYNLAGHWYDGADPFLLHVEPNCKSIKHMLDYGWSKPDKLHEMYRWGFKAFNKFWPGLVLDVQDWCAHRSQHSWGMYANNTSL